MQKNYNERTCNKCGWVAFAVTREHAENEVKTFNEFYDMLSEEKQEQHYGGRRSTIKQYEHCGLCGNNYKDFRDSKEDDCPIGVTLGPIITEDNFTYDDAIDTVAEAIKKEIDDDIINDVIKAAKTND